MGLTFLIGEADADRALFHFHHEVELFLEEGLEDPVAFHREGQDELPVDVWLAGSFVLFADQARLNLDHDSGSSVRANILVQGMLFPFCDCFVD